MSWRSKLDVFEAFWVISVFCRRLNISFVIVGSLSTCRKTKLIVYGLSTWTSDSIGFSSFFGEDTYAGYFNDTITKWVLVTKFRNCSVSLNIT